MTVLETQETRLEELRTQIDALYEARGALIDKAAEEKRDFTDAEKKDYDDAGTKRAAAEKAFKETEERIAELKAKEAREAAAAATRTETGETRKGGATTKDPEVYARGNRDASFFRDMARSQLFGDREAGERLRRHSMQVTETRALGNTNAAGGSGGEFAPPAWLVEDFVALARAGRVTDQLYTKSQVPAGVSSVNLPKILTGTTVALQSTQNTALSQTDLTTGSVGTGFSTLGGKQISSQQLLDQSEIDFDQVIKSDLAGAWGLTVGTQIISGTGTGANNNSVINGLASAVVPAGNQITFTSGSPTAALFYSKAAGMLAAFAANRFAPPTAWIMHPRRWFWLLAQTDTAGRPLVVPDAMLASAMVQSHNPIATNTGNPAAVAGVVGVFLGLPVVIDPLIPTNIGAGTNQDEVFLIKQDDLWLFESDPVAEVFRETYADSMGVLFRLYSYVGTILNRQTASIATMNGTGLIAPTF